MKLTLQLPIPDPVLSPNAREHWSIKAKATKAARGRAHLEALRVLDGNEAPFWKKARYTATLFTLSGRSRDPDNFNASLKAYIDGIADAGIVSNDRDLWPERPVFFKTDRFPRVEIHIEPEEV